MPHCAHTIAHTTVPHACVCADDGVGDGGGGSDAGSNSSATPGSYISAYAVALTVDADIEHIKDAVEFGNKVLDGIASAIGVERGNLQFIGLQPGSVKVNFLVTQAEGTPQVDLKAVVDNLERHVDAGTLTLTSAGVQVEAFSSTAIVTGRV